MRIYDNKNRKSLKSILIMLTKTEVNQLIGFLESLKMNDHAHINDDQYKREITIGLYSPENFQHFNKDVVQLIESDE